MKILAIRGRNLASLAGDFAVELEQSPLADTGLILITGPTGAGKSTLLDTLCLALFDRTPRFSGQKSEVRVGSAGEALDERLTVTDPRSVLRRGAAVGYAEVEFLGRDKHRYRSRWTVRRARNKAEGTLQKQAVELWDLTDDGKALGGTKTETLRVIEERLGLSFDQFRRSVLLAQGEFAAFLQASARERAELLERMTGTDIYSALSIAAYRRAAEQKQAIEALLSKQQHLLVLDAEARASLEAQLLQEQDRAEQAKACVQHLEAALVWHATLRQLCLEEAAAQAEKEAAKDAWEQAAGVRHEIHEVESAQPLRPVVEHVDRAAQELAQALHEHTQAEITGAKTAVREQSAEAAVAVSGAQCEQQKNALERARPALSEARRLDAELQSLTRRLQELRAAETQTKHESRKAQERAAGLRAELNAKERLLTEAKQWFASHEALRLLVEGWAHWEAQLRYYQDALGAHASASALSQSLSGLASEARDRAERGKAEQTELGSRVATAEQTVRAAEDEHMRVVALVRPKERDALDQEREHLLGLSELVAHAEALGLAYQQAWEDETRARQRAQQVTMQMHQCRAERASLEALITDGEHALQAARMSHELTAYRAMLREHDPCPLCGATEHPWASHNAPEGPLLDQQQDHLRALRKDQTSLDRAEATAQAQYAHCIQEAEAASQRARSLQHELTQTQEQFQGLRSSLSSDDVPDAPCVTDPSIKSALAQSLARLEERRQVLRIQEREAETLAAKAHKARAELDSVRKAWNTSAEALRAAESERLSTQQALFENTHERKRAQEAKLRVREELTKLFVTDTAWCARLDSAPEGLFADMRSQREQWVSRTQAYEAAKERSLSLRVQVETAEALAQAQCQIAKQQTFTCTACDDELRRLQRERTKWFEGRSAIDVEEAFGAALETASSALDEARKTLGLAMKEAATATIRLSEATRIISEKRVSQERAQNELTHMLTLHRLGLNTLRAHLDREEAWIRSQRVLIEALDKRRDETTTVLAERITRRKTHEVARPAHLSEPPAEESLAQAQRELQSAEEALMETRTQLRADDGVRTQRDALLPGIEAQQKIAAVWNTMAELIGSADGKKFRVFAQSLTLDALVAYANAHLKDLTGRYQLMRIPGHDLDLQIVDKDMGDEVRSVASLSGGESFLVSLALALGLSSFAAHKTLVQSLFIDEGFGSLDPATLDAALAALDALQATGRQVTVISHVPALAERVGAHVHVVRRGPGRSMVRVGFSS